VLSDDSILLLFRPASALLGEPQTWELRRYADDGTLLQTIPAGSYPDGAVNAPPRFVVTDDEASVWLMGILTVASPTGIQQFRNFRLSDGVELDAFQVPNVSGSLDPDTPGAVSFCCPLMFLARSCDDTSVDEDECEPTAPTIGCWTPGTPSVSCAEGFSGPPRAGCWGSSFSVDALRVGLRDA